MYTTCTAVKILSTLLDLVEEVVAAYGAVPLSSSDHEGLDVDHAGADRLQRHHIETFTDQIVTRDERSPLTLSEGAGLTSRRPREEEEEEEERAGGHLKGKR